MLLKRWVPLVQQPVATRGQRQRSYHVDEDQLMPHAYLFPRAYTHGFDSAFLRALRRDAFCGIRVLLWRARTTLARPHYFGCSDTAVSPGCSTAKSVLSIFKHFVYPLGGVGFQTKMYSSRSDDRNSGG